MQVPSFLPPSLSFNLGPRRTRRARGRWPPHRDVRRSRRTSASSCVLGRCCHTSTTRVPMAWRSVATPSRCGATTRSQTRRSSSLTGCSTPAARRTRCTKALRNPPSPPSWRVSTPLSSLTGRPARARRTPWRVPPRLRASSRVRSATSSRTSSAVSWRHPHASASSCARPTCRSTMITSRTCCGPSARAC